MKMALNPLQEKSYFLLPLRIRIFVVYVLFGVQILSQSGINITNHGK